MKHGVHPPNTVLPSGVYDATVESAVDKVSTKGNEMLEMTLVLHGTDGRKGRAFDYLVATEGGAWKIAQFCVAAGIDYGIGVVMPDRAMGAYVRCTVDVDDNPKYGKKNIISGYLGPALARQPSVDAETYADNDDDIPF